MVAHVFPIAGLLVGTAFMFLPTSSPTEPRPTEQVATVAQVHRPDRAPHSGPFESIETYLAERQLAPVAFDPEVLELLEISLDALEADWDQLRKARRDLLRAKMTKEIQTGRAIALNSFGTLGTLGGSTYTHLESRSGQIWRIDVGLGELPKVDHLSQQMKTIKQLGVNMVDDAMETLLEKGGQ